MRATPKTSVSKKTLILLALFIAGIFFSCKKEDNTPANRPPVANAGSDTTITLPANIANLNGTASTDPDINITDYQWTKVDGPSSFSINNANSVTTQVTNLAEGVYQLELKVTDAEGLNDKDTVQVTVAALQPPLPGDVYIAGMTNASGTTAAALWKNGVVQNLTNGQYDAEANSVAISGSDVYVTAWENVAGSDGGKARLWKNGVIQNLPGGFGWGMSVFVSNNDVYVVGAGLAGAISCKNGVVEYLPGFRPDCKGFGAFSVFVSGTDVYIAGYELNDESGAPGSGGATLWKNGVAQNLADGNAYGFSVFVYGNDVYVAGGQYNGPTSSVAKLWKNGVVYNLSDGQTSASANSVFVSGSGDVYVAGFVGNSAVLWKNNIAQDLGAGIATSAFVSENDVYVVINNNNTAKLWKNGITSDLIGLIKANSVLVVK